jgi:hypothetical protein
MPWKRKSSRGFVLKWLATGMLVGNRYIRRDFRPISGQIFNSATGAVVGGGSWYSNQVEASAAYLRSGQAFLNSVINCDRSWVRERVQAAAPPCLFGSLEDALKKRLESRKEQRQAAALSVDVPAREAQVLDALEHLPNREGTNEEITDYMSRVNEHDEVPNISPRIAPLRRKGYIKDTGRTRKSRQGKAQKMWALL